MATEFHKETTEKGETKNDASRKGTEIPSGLLKIPEGVRNYSNENQENEDKEKKGGSYSDVKKSSDGETHEVHHMPADKVNNLPYNDGPAIKMDKEDHKQTASYGKSKEAQEYRDKQKELIEQGKFREAFEMDVEDIREKFGDKYDDAIAEAEEYVKKLEEEGRV